MNPSWDPSDAAKVDQAVAAVRARPATAAAAAGTCAAGDETCDTTAAAAAAAAAAAEPVPHIVSPARGEDATLYVAGLEPGCRLADLDALVRGCRPGSPTSGSPPSTAASQAHHRGWPGVGNAAFAASESDAPVKNRRSATDPGPTPAYNDSDGPGTQSLRLSSRRRACGPLAQPRLRVAASGGFAAFQCP